jgi:hypothetical protein
MQDIDGHCGGRREEKHEHLFVEYQKFQEYFDTGSSFTGLS